MSLSSATRRCRAVLAGVMSVLMLGSSSVPAVSAPSGSPLRIGVYYFPGWDGSDNRNWDAIKPYPEREPLLGWYKGADPAVMRQQLRWMKEYGLSYVAFDWYWQGGKVGSDATLNTYLGLTEQPVDFAVMWANDGKGIGLDEWRRIVGFWADHYLSHPRYLRLKGQPVVFVLTQQGFVGNATDAGLTPAAYLAAAQAVARQHGLPGIRLVAGFDDLSYGFVTDDAPAQGFGAVSAYNFHRTPLAPWKPGWEKVRHPLTHGYREMDDAYRANWDAARRSRLPVVLPMTTGWDARAWRGSGDPLHDHSVATPAEFRAHLSAARQAMLKPGKAKSGLGVICCWNEYGEGSYLEPTKQRRFAMLEQVRAVFGAR